MNKIAVIKWALIALSSMSGHDGVKGREEALRQNLILRYKIIL